MRVKLFSQGADAAIQLLEDEINAFLDSIDSPHVRYVSLSSSDIERSASVWYDDPKPMRIEQTVSAQLQELIEDA